MGIGERLLALVGLDFDFSIDIRPAFFSEIHPRLCVSGQPTPAHIGPLKDAGITHVVSCLESAELPHVHFLDASFATLRVELRDSMDADITPYLPAFFAFADEAAKLLVHCRAGMSRSVAFATALIMRDQGRAFFDAFQYVRQKRPGVLPNIGFASQLQRFEHSILPERRHDEVSSLARYLRQAATTPAELSTIEQALAACDFHAPTALRAIFGGEIPRVVQGTRR